MWEMKIYDSKNGKPGVSVEEQVLQFLNKKELKPENVKISAHFSPGGEKMWKAIVYYYAGCEKD